MSKLLSSDCFDSFLLVEANIRMQVTFHLDGKLNQDFFDHDVWNNRSLRPYDFAPWADVRHYCRDCIKGSHAPAFASFVLTLKPEYLKASLSDVPENTRNAVASLVITIRLDGAVPAEAAETAPAGNGSTPTGTRTAAGSTTPTKTRAAGPDGGLLRLRTGISYGNFVLDKSAEQAWDRTMERFLQVKGIEYEKET